MSSKATTVAAYLAGLDPAHRKVVAAVRKVIRANLPKGYVESMNRGMIAYEIPLTRSPDTYNRQPLMYVALARQKNHYALHLSGIYGEPKLAAELKRAYADAGLKPDMGKGCVRFRTLDAIPLATIGELVARVPVEDYLRRYEQVKGKPRR